MKKQMERTVYEAPVTERFSVELEGGFMSASIMEDAPQNANGVSSSAQEYHEFSAADGFVGSSDANGNFSITWE